jgi:sugar phosphate isomerase/epimerase
MIIANRRSFLRFGSMAAISATVPHGWCRTAPAPKAVAVGAQLYTLHKEVMEDLPGALAALKKIGFQMVEGYSGMYTRPAKELRAMIEDAGLTLPSSHFAYDTLESQLDYAHDLGVTYMVCAMLPKPYQNRDGFAKAAATFNAVGAKAKSMNIKLGFHNHNFEFQPLPGATDGAATDSGDIGLKLLLDQTDPALVSWEEDCYWVAQGGLNPLTLLQKYSARIPMLHLKDRTADATTTYGPGKNSQFFTEIGTGTIDWSPIVRLAQSSGKLMFIEQDTTKMPAIESLAVSYKNLRKYLA